MKIGMAICLGLMMTSLCTGCVWRGSHYDADSGIVYGGGFDSFHRRWLDNMRGDLREYRRNRDDHRDSVKGEACDECWDRGADSCGCGDDRGYNPPRRSRHYGRSDNSYGSYETYGDGEFIDGEFDGEYVVDDEMMHQSRQHSGRRGGSCPTCGPRMESQSADRHYEEEMSSEGWQEVSPNEYHDSHGEPRKHAPPPPSAPPVSSEPQQATPAPVPVPEDGPGPGSNHSTRRDARALQWVPSRL
ncbi:MAG: hypothetical protein ACKVT0_01700 [Planctomycetaceae bacterium]